MARRDLCLALLGLFLLVGGALLLFAMIWGDAPEVADSDLRVERAAVRPDENAYGPLHEAASHARLKHAQAKHLRLLVWTADSDAPLARAAVRKNAEALRLLGRALRRRALQVPASRSKADVRAESQAWQELATISAIRAIGRARRGDVEGALSDAATPLRLGRLVESNYDRRIGSGIDYGLQLQRTGIDALAAVIPHLALSKAQSRRWIAALEGTRSDPAAWRRLWAWEYRTVEHGFARSNLSETRQKPREMRTSNLLQWLTELGLLKYQYKPNATMNLYAGWIRQLQAHAGQTCSRMPRPPVGGWHAMSKPDSRLGPNGLGRLWLSPWPGYDLYAERFRCQVESQIGSAEVLLALRAYQVEHGELPASLDALVPDEIAAIPTSAMDGRPLRYSRSAGTVCANDQCGNKGLPKPEERSSSCGCRHVSVGLPISF